MEQIIKYIFGGCVYALLKLADFFGTDYYTINVILFCVIMPAVFIAMLFYIIHLREVNRKLLFQIKYPTF